MTSQGFDVVWAVALALNNTRQRLLDMGSSMSLVWCVCVCVCACVGLGDGEGSNDNMAPQGFYVVLCVGSVCVCSVYVCVCVCVCGVCGGGSVGGDNSDHMTPGSDCWTWVRKCL